MTVQGWLRPLRAAERSAPKYSQVGESRDSTGFVCFFPHHVLGGPHNFRVFSVFCLAFPALGVGQGDAEKSLPLGGKAAF